MKPELEIIISDINANIPQIAEIANGFSEFFKIQLSVTWDNNIEYITAHGKTMELLENKSNIYTACMHMKNKYCTPSMLKGNHQYYLNIIMNSFQKYDPIVGKRIFSQLSPDYIFMELIPSKMDKYDPDTVIKIIQKMDINVLLPFRYGTKDKIRQTLKRNPDIADRVGLVHRPSQKNTQLWDFNLKSIRGEPTTDTNQPPIHKDPIHSVKYHILDFDTPCPSNINNILNYAKHILPKNADIRIGVNNGVKTNGATDPAKVFSLFKNVRAWQTWQNTNLLIPSI